MTRSEYQRIYFFRMNLR